MKLTPKPNKQANIWYKNYMVLIFVIGLPVLVVVICLFFIFYSIKIQDSTVRDDWYMDGKTLYQDSSRDQLAHDLGVFGVMRLSWHANITDIRFELNYPTNNLAAQNFRHDTPLTYPNELSVHISHATDDTKDRDFTIVHQKDNVYVGKVQLDDTPAKYYLQISSPKPQNWRLIQHENLPKSNIVFLPLSSFDEERRILPDQRNKRPSADKSF